MSDPNQFGQQGAFPPDLKMLETLISQMHGQKRVYVSQKIKHFQEILKKWDILTLVTMMSFSCKHSVN